MGQAALSRETPQRSKDEPALTYRDVGVASSDEMRSFAGAIKRFRTTHGFSRIAPPHDLGVDEPYASVLDLREFAPNLGLAIATDGVGTKILVAEALQKYDTVGIDCVAMNANDILCVGAVPVSMVDYIAVKSTDNNQLDELAKGLVEGARLAHISIPGGETAQVGEMLADSGEAFDLVGTCVGTVALDRVLDGERIEPGNALIGYASTGIHSNGLALARKVFQQAGIKITDHVSEFERTLGEELLEPTAIYVDLALALRNELNVRMFSHITSDGFINLTRLPRSARQDMGFEITALPEKPPVFELIQERGGIEDAEMFRVFNMGIGFCAVVPEQEAERALAIGDEVGISGMRLGTVTARKPEAADCSEMVTIRTDHVSLRSCGKQFERIG